MMIHDEGPIGFMIGIVVGFIIGTLVGGCTTTNTWEKQAVKDGVGEYSPDRGEFRFKDIGD